MENDSILSVSTMQDDFCTHLENNMAQITYIRNVFKCTTKAKATAKNEKKTRAIVLHRVTELMLTVHTALCTNAETKLYAAAAAAVASNHSTRKSQFSSFGIHFCFYLIFHGQIRSYLFCWSVHCVVLHLHTEKWCRRWPCAMHVRTLAHILFCVISLLSRAFLNFLSVCFEFGPNEKDRFVHHIQRGAKKKRRWKGECV